MRKKDILGNFVKNPDVLYDYEIKKVNEEPEAYSALISFLPGSREFFVDYEGRKVCLSAHGYKWLVYLPLDKYWCVTAFYNSENELFEWYFDISKGNFYDENNIPCIDDIFLDLVVFPDGRVITLDADELQEALDKNEITVSDYNHAYRVHAQIKNSKWSDAGFLKELSGELLAEYI